MKDAGLKYIFFTGSLILLAAMLFLSRYAGVSCDEVLHYEQSEAVYRYFASHGADQSALDTPGSHLKYYGQSYDNVVTILARWLSIEDVYSFRHFMSSLAGWLTVFITGLFAVWISGYRTGILVLLLFAVSPTFMGHSKNNLKDIPFATGYISGIFFSLKIIFSEKRIRYMDVVLLILSMAFCISIRAGGLILICYLFLFFMVSAIRNRFKRGFFDLKMEGFRLLIIVLLSAAAFFMGILLWPFALQAPLKNVMESFQVMTNFPSTFRQIFEGEVIWSDFMPWYYLPKSMAITIPVIVSAGFMIFLLLVRQAYRSGKWLEYLLVIFTVFFPVVYVIVTKSNIYSSWRQFLFVYPPAILIAAAGFSHLFSLTDRKLLRLIVAAVLIIIAIDPVIYMIRNPRYCYLYYNQLTRGLKGACGNYETDYYYVSQTEASEWLIRHLEEKDIDSATVMATFPVGWHFRNHPGIKTGYLRNEERSMFDWDYAIVANRYIHPFHLKNGMWPPSNTIHTIIADDVPLCAVLERRTKADLHALRALEAGNNSEAIRLFKEAMEIDCKDEMIFYNFARALYNNGEYQKADSVLKAGLEINPYSEPILMYLGNIAAFIKNKELALGYYDRLTGVNRKYFQAYIESAKLMALNDVKKARGLLRECLRMNPGYKPAVKALADTYRETDPDIAAKYDEMAEKLE